MIQYSTKDGCHNSINVLTDAELQNFRDMITIAQTDKDKQTLPIYTDINIIANTVMNNRIYPDGMQDFTKINISFADKCANMKDDTTLMTTIYSIITLNHSKFTNERIFMSSSSLTTKLRNYRDKMNSNHADKEEFISIITSSLSPPSSLSSSSPSTYSFPSYTLFIDNNTKYTTHYNLLLKYVKTKCARHFAKQILLNYENAKTTRHSLNDDYLLTRNILTQHIHDIYPSFSSSPVYSLFTSCYPFADNFDHIKTKLLRKINHYIIYLITSSFSRNISDPANIVTFFPSTTPSPTNFKPVNATSIKSSNTRKSYDIIDLLTAYFDYIECDVIFTEMITTQSHSYAHTENVNTMYTDFHNDPKYYGRVQINVADHEYLQPMINNSNDMFEHVFVQFKPTTAAYNNICTYLTNYFLMDRHVNITSLYATNNSFTQPNASTITKASKLISLLLALEYICSNKYFFRYANEYIGQCIGYINPTLVLTSIIKYESKIYKSSTSTYYTPVNNVIHFKGGNDDDDINDNTDECNGCNDRKYECVFGNVLMLLFVGVFIAIVVCVIVVFVKNKKKGESFHHNIVI